MDYPRKATELEARMFESGLAISVEELEKSLIEFKRIAKERNLNLRECHMWGGCYGCKAEGEEHHTIIWCIA